jgi:ribosomal-protein-alanine N-acetyltransferase
VTAIAIRPVMTDRLTLEPLRSEHAPEMFAVLSDPALYEFERSPPASVSELAERYTRQEARQSSDGQEQWLNWMIRLPSGELAGYVQATVTADRRALIAYELASRFWGHGYGREAVTSMLAELVATHGVRDSVAVFKCRNERSRRLLTHLGFTAAPDEILQALDVQSDESVMYRPH